MTEENSGLSKVPEKTGNKFAIIIPVYNHAEMVPSVIKKSKELGFPVYVIDDGSTDRTYEEIKDIQGIKIIRHNINMGKGAAILTGFKEVLKSADWAITIDADGQHEPGDALKMIKSMAAAWLYSIIY